VTFLSHFAVLVRRFARRLSSASAGVRAVLVATVSSPLCAMATVQAVLSLNAAAVSIPCPTQASQQLRVATFNGMKAFPVLKKRPTALALRLVASRRPLRISAAADPETLQVVSSLIAEQLAIDIGQVKADSKFTDLGADSLDTVEIMMALEEKFEIQLDEDNAEQIVTVQHAADLIQDVVAAKKA
jgi:acyl carrier protein